MTVHAPQPAMSLPSPREHISFSSIADGPASSHNVPGGSHGHKPGPSTSMAAPQSSAMTATASASSVSSVRRPSTTSATKGRPAHASSSYADPHAGPSSQPTSNHTSSTGLYSSNPPSAAASKNNSFIGGVLSRRGSTRERPERPEVSPALTNSTKAAGGRSRADSSDGRRSPTESEV